MSCASQDDADYESARSSPLNEVAIDDAGYNKRDRVRHANEKVNGGESATLYVGDLDPDVTESMLFDKFCTAGRVMSIRVCRDAITRRSLGYAYVNFQQPADAERALDTMNLDLLNGQPIRIMWSQRDPAMRRSGTGNIFIKNLDQAIDNKSIYDTFSLFGTILCCKVAIDDEGNSKGYGFVHFETEEAATRAIEKVDGMLLAGKKVFVGKFQPRSVRLREMGESAKRFSNVFIKNLEEDVDKDKLETIFSEFGKVTSCAIIKSDDKATGFGFVAFEEPEQAEKAVKEMDGKQLDGSEKKLSVCRAQKKGERQAELKRKYEQKKAERMQRYQRVNLYVKNLDDTVDEHKLRELFEKYGTITSCKVKCDENDRSMRFGFVCYEKPEEATKAISEMNGNMTFSKPLHVALAQRKEDRRAQLAALYMSRLANMRMNNTIPATMYTPGTGGYFVNSTMASNRGGFLPAEAPIVQNAGSRPVGVQNIENSKPAQPMMYNHDAAAVAAPRTVQTGIMVGGQDPITSGMLAQATPHYQEQRHMLVERIHSEFARIYGDRADVGKIAGILLQMDNSELNMLLQDEELFRFKFNEAALVPSDPKAN